jgi:hypothetical protein
MRQKDELTQEQLKELLHYDASTGVFRWRHFRRPSIKAGDVAGNRQAKGYVQIMINQKNYLAHRLAWLYMTGAWPKDQIDHINHDKSDNSWINLREANDSENQQNKPAERSIGSSGLLGVTWSKASRKWAAQIKINGRRIHLGLHASAEEAHQAYVAAKRELHPFGNL